MTEKHLPLQQSLFRADNDSDGHFRTIADIPRAYHGVAFVAGFIYIIGGFDGSNYFNSVRKMNVSTFEWTQVAGDKKLNVNNSNKI